MKKILIIISTLAFGLNLNAQDIPDFGSPQKMGRQINSAGNETMPIFINNKMFFSRSSHADNKGGITAGMDLWYTEYSSSEESWNTAKNDLGSINNKLHNAAIGISGDGNTLYLLNQYLDGGKMAPGVSYSENTSGNWSDPINLEIPGLEDVSGIYGFFMTKDGKTLIMSFEKSGGKGMEDLYVTEKKDGLWTEPKSLGVNINTSGYEMSPFITDDGSTMYFASSGHKGFGSADIFMSKKVGNSWSNWTNPVNLGAKINTDKFEAYFTQPKGTEYFYYVHNNNQTGDDVYRVKVGEEEVKVEPTVLVSGLVFEEKNRQPMAVKIDVKNEKNEVVKTIKSDKEGNYEIELDKGKSYTFNILTKGYHEHHDVVVTPSLEDETNTMEYNFPMKKLEVGSKIDLGHLYFVVNTDSLRQISLPQVEKLEKILVENPDLKIRIEGHTDNSGLKHLNLKLSVERADKIKAMLVEKGIKKSRLKTEGYGATKPIVKNDTEEHRKENRRVDFVIIK